jgi:hypothetical protein
VIRPDLSLSLGVDGYDLRWFCEIDRSSESVPTVIRKCQLYAEYYQSGAEQAKHDVFPHVCWITPDEERTERLREAIAKNRHLPERLFTVTTSAQAVATLRSYQ